MAAIWNDITIVWDDEEYTVTPTMKFLNYLEQGDGCSLSKMMVRLHNQDLPSASACSIIAKTLSFAGKPTTDEDVYAATGGLTGEVISAATSILIGCMPAPKESKKKATRKPRKSSNQ